MTKKEAKQILSGDFCGIDLNEKSHAELFAEAFEMALEVLGVE